MLGQVGVQQLEVGAVDEAAEVPHLQLDVVGVGEAVDADHLVPFVEQPPAQRGSDEPGCAGDDRDHVTPSEWYVRR